MTTFSDTKALRLAFKLFGIFAKVAKEKHQGPPIVKCERTSKTPTTLTMANSVAEATVVLDTDEYDYTAFYTEYYPFQQFVSKHKRVSVDATGMPGTLCLRDSEGSQMAFDSVSETLWYNSWSGITFKEYGCLTGLQDLPQHMWQIQKSFEPFDVSHRILLRKKEMVVDSTNRHCYLTASLPMHNAKTGLEVYPTAFAVEWLHLFADQGDVFVSIANEKRVCFTVKDSAGNCRATLKFTHPDSKFPEVETVTRPRKARAVTVNAGDAVRALAIVKTDESDLMIRSNTIACRSTRAGALHVQTKDIWCAYTQDAFSVGINPYYLIAGLKAFGPNVVNLEFDAAEPEGHPMRITSPDVSGRQYYIALRKRSGA